LVVKKIFGDLLVRMIKFLQSIKHTHTHTHTRAHTHTHIHIYICHMYV